jgi:hypothetical protein
MILIRLITDELQKHRVKIQTDGFLITRLTDLRESGSAILYLFDQN